MIRRLEIRMKFLSINNVSKTFDNFVALNHINFSVEQGEFVCLLGPSGCGKTTLLRTIAGLEQPNVGSKIFLENTEITNWPPHKRDFGIVFQSYALFPNMTVSQNIAYGLNSKKINKQKVKEKVQEALTQVNLERVQNSYPSQLSGGQQQRVALARALAMSPSFLLLDEPLSALDAKVRLRLRMEIRSLQKKLGITTIMVTHDQEEALSMGDKIVVMNEASIEQIGTPKEVYNYPKTPFVADFIGTINFFKTAGSYAAIRPENIIVEQKQTVNSMKAIVENIEFRGSSYRLYVKLHENNNVKTDNELLIVDIPVNQGESLFFDKGKTLFVRFPEQKIIVYESGEQAERIAVSSSI